MNKTQLIDALAARFEGNRKAAAHALDAVIDTITREIANGEKVAITGFGAFEKKMREARLVRNPSTGDLIEAAAKAVPKFTAGADLKNVISGAKELPALTLEMMNAAAQAVGMAPRKSPAPQAAAKPAATKAPAKTAAKKSAAKKTTKSATAAPAKKAATKKTTAKSAAKKTTAASTAKKTAAKSTAKKAPAKAAAPAKKATATKTAAKTAAKKTTTKKATATKAATKKTTAKKAPAKKATS